MNSQSNIVPDSPHGSQTVSPAIIPATRPMYWSVRRELWENRSIYIGPLAVAGVILFAFLISTIHPPVKWRAALVDPAHQREAIETPYDVAAFLILVTTFIVGVFYSLDALHGERRDRSILFWKSLPVSDLTTVLSKASIPLMVLPLFIFPVIVTTQVLMLLMNIAMLLGNGLSVATLSAHLPLFKMSLALLYSLIAIALWHAPIYGWLLLVSAWARRTSFLWATLPLGAICVFEKIAFHTWHFASLLGYRLIGWFTQAFVPEAQSGAPMDPLQGLAPGKFLSTPGLWIGLAFAAALLAAAVRMRRYRDPI
jgi:ABC-2 type transport system permease protein